MFITYFVFNNLFSKPFHGMLILRHCCFLNLVFLQSIPFAQATKPLLNLQLFFFFFLHIRYKMVRACKWVDEVRDETVSVKITIFDLSLLCFCFHHNFTKRTFLSFLPMFPFTSYSNLSILGGGGCSLCDVRGDSRQEQLRLLRARRCVDRSSENKITKSVI